MAEKAFDWGRTPQLSIPQILLATFAPSAVAYLGFHGLLPRLVAGQIPVRIAWPASGKPGHGGNFCFGQLLVICCNCRLA